MYDYMYSSHWFCSSRQPSVIHSAFVPLINRTENRDSNQCLHMDVPLSTISNGQKVKSAKKCITCGPAMHGILLSHKRNEVPTIIQDEGLPGWQDDSPGKGACHKAWQHELGSQDPHDRRGQTPESCPLIPLHSNMLSLILSQ